MFRSRLGDQVLACFERATEFQGRHIITRSDYDLVIMCRRCGCLESFEAGVIRSAVVEGMLEAALLAFCAGSPHYGYELVRMLRESGVIAGQVHGGRVYESLVGLERSGFLAVRVEEGGSGPERRIYSITDEGRVRLHRWDHSLRGSLSALSRLLDRIHGDLGGGTMSCNCKCNCGPRSSETKAEEPEAKQNRTVEERLEAIESLLGRLIVK